MTSKTIVITGGFGYIGGRMAQKFAADGLHVRVWTRKSSNQIPRWAFETSNIKWSNDLGELCQGADVLIHLAAPDEVYAAKYPEISIQETNTLTRQALDASKRSHIPRFIYFSTVHVYGAPLKGRYQETSDALPAHPYSAAHFQSENLVNEAHGGDMHTIVFRLANGFGAPADQLVDRWTLLVSDLCRQACVDRQMALTTSGEQLRDFIPLSDVIAASAFFIFADDDVWKYRAVNLASGVSISIYQMAETILTRAQKIIHPEITLSAPMLATNEKDMELLIDISRIRSLGFEPKRQNNIEIDNLLKFCQATFEPKR